MPVLAIDQVQLAMPEGGEDEARQFYCDLLGLSEVSKPRGLAKRGGCWFENEHVKLHLGVDRPFIPARKAHPALLVSGLASITAAIAKAGLQVEEDEPLPGHDRAYVTDPFGNRIELLEPRGDVRS